MLMPSSGPQLTATLWNLRESNAYVSRASELAKARSQDAQVRDLADKMEREHRDMDVEIKVYAQRHNVDLNLIRPEQVDAKAEVAEHQGFLNHLETVTGPTFDQEFMAAMSAEHRTLNGRITMARELAPDDEAKDMFSSLLRRVQRHQGLMDSWLRRSSIQARAR
jgi:predicted outer membrane protein